MKKTDPSNAELLEFIKENVTTKEDLKLMATKEELKTLATKEDLKLAIAPLATKEELRRATAPLATKEELRRATAPLATKEELKRMDRDLHHKLDGIGKQLTDLQTEKAANTAAHQRFDHRDRVFAGKLGVNLDKVDAGA